MNRPFLLIVPLLPFLASCRTIRHTTAKAQTIMVHDTIQQHVIVRRTDSVLIIKTDSGTRQREKSHTIVYAADKERRHEAQRDTITIVQTAAPTASPSRQSTLLPAVMAVIILVLVFRRT